MKFFHPSKNEVDVVLVDVEFCSCKEDEASITSVDDVPDEEVSPDTVLVVEEPVVGD